VSLVFPAAAILLPIVRYPGFAWLIAAGALLPVERRGAAGSSRRAPARSALRLGEAAEDTP
jgi:hypothetical protein